MLSPIKLTSFQAQRSKPRLYGRLVFPRSLKAGQRHVGQQPALHTDNLSSTPGKPVSVLSPVSDCQLLLTSAPVPSGQILPRPVL